MFFPVCRWAASRQLAQGASHGLGGGGVQTTLLEGNNKLCPRLLKW